MLSDAGQLLQDSERVFRYGNTIVLEMDSENGKRIVPLLTDHQTDPTTDSLLSNLMVCEQATHDPEAPPTQFPLPRRFVELLLNHEPTYRRLPQIKLYATRPVFDHDFLFRGPGWHSEVQYLVHGPDVEPIVPECASTADCPRDRLPHRLRELLVDFCFRSSADLVNAVAVLLTGLLLPHFVRTGKPVVLLDGNQPSVGKTLLAQVISVIFDGSTVQAIPYTCNDEELQKQICANLRSHSTSVVLIDNAKTSTSVGVSSPTLEANSTSPEVSFRILGQSVNYRRPNDLIWLLTMNATKASPDLVSRSIAIRLQHDGEPERRDFAGRDPLAYAARHRNEILGELAGMIIFWSQQGQRNSTKRHRLTAWAAVIGGILETNGLTEFLENLDEAAGEFNTSLDELTAIAESVVARADTTFYRTVTDTQHVSHTDGPPFGRPATDWITVFQTAGVLADELEQARSQRAKATKVGRFLSQHLGRRIAIERSGLVAQARLQDTEGRSNQRLYYFEILGDVAAETDSSPMGNLLSDGLDPSTPGPVTPASQVIGDISTSRLRDADNECDRNANQGNGNQEQW